MEEKGLEWIEKIAKHWPTRKGLALTLLLVLGTSKLLPMPVEQYEAACRFGIFIVMALIAVSAWLWSRRLPKTSPDRVGILVCIRSDDDSVHATIDEDFIHTLQKLLKQGKAGEKLQILRARPDIASGIVDQETANELRRRCKAHFAIYGRVRKRMLNDKEQLVLDLDGIVVHRRIPEEHSIAFSAEFSELFPRHVLVENESAFLGLSLTSELVSCVSKYIIGIAAAISGDLEFAECAYGDVKNHMASVRGKSSPYKDIRERVHQRLVELYRARALVCYASWCKTHDRGEMEKMGMYLERIPPSHSNTYPIYLSKAIASFVLSRDLSQSKKFIDEASKCAGEDGTWLFSRALLHAYGGDLKKASQSYQKAIAKRFPEHVIAEVEEFLWWLLEVEPERCEVLFCLGYINRNAKHDHEVAMTHFRSFISHDKSSLSEKERSLAIRWVEEGLAESRKAS